MSELLNDTYLPLNLCSMMAFYIYTQPDVLHIFFKKIEGQLFKKMI